MSDFKIERSNFLGHIHQTLSDLFIEKRAEEKISI